MKNIYNIEQSEIGNIVIFSCFDRSKELKRAYASCLISEFKGFYEGFTLLFESTKITIVTTGPGSSRVGDAVLALQGAPCKFVFYSGAAGGIGDTIKVGDIIVPERAVIGDGFSVYHKKLVKEHLFSDYSNSSRELISKFQDYINTQSLANISLHIGNIFTVESIFAETKSFLAKLQANNVIAIDMETSAFFTAAQKISLPCMAIHYISDLPQSGDIPSILHKTCSKIYVKLPYLLIDFIRNELIDECRK